MNLTSFFRYALKEIESQLDTSIDAIPKDIDKRLYVSEYQNESNFDELTKKAIISGRGLPRSNKPSDEMKRETTEIGTDMATANNNPN